jgi:hypothetical protein
MPLLLSEHEKQEQKNPTPDPLKYDHRYKVYQKPMHRNWCGQGDKRWNGYAWEEE